MSCPPDPFCSMWSSTRSSGKKGVFFVSAYSSLIRHRSPAQLMLFVSCIYDGKPARFYELCPVFRELCPEIATGPRFEWVYSISPPSETCGSQKGLVLNDQRGIFYQFIGSRTSGKRGFFPLSEGPSKMTDPELLRKTIVFLFRHTVA